MSVTINMNLTLPTPSVTAGPTWATQQVTAIETIDAHDHSTGKGVKVPASGLDINANLSVGSNQLTSVKSINLTSEAANLSAANVQSIYSVSGNLWFNNSTGTPVQVTQGNSIASASSPLVPSGVIWAFGGASAPTGFLLCQGSAVSRTTYADLFAAIGTQYGVGDGATTFNLPNMQGRVPVGSGTYTDTVSGALTRTIGQTVGAAAHTLATAELASHTHTANAHNHRISGEGGGGIVGLGAASGVVAGISGSGGNTYVAGGPSAPGNKIIEDTTVTINSTVSGTAHNNMQPSLGTNYIIKT